MQSLRPVGRVAELGSLGRVAHPENMLNFLRKLFGGKDNSRRVFDRNVIFARVVDYHMTKHLKPGQKVDLFHCHLEYTGGPKAVVAVPYFSGKEQVARFYVYDFDTGEIEDYPGEIALPR